MNEIKVKKDDKKPHSYTVTKSNGDRTYPLGEIAYYHPDSEWHFSIASFISYFTADDILAIQQRMQEISAGCPAEHRRIGSTMNGYCPICKDKCKWTAKPTITAAPFERWEAKAAFDGGFIRREANSKEGAIELVEEELKRMGLS